mgnify:CR=1 FL=1
MDRIDVELFLAVVKWNSITKASEIMHFSQPTVSYRLKLLEKEMGVQLFHRHKGQRTSELTQQGEQFIDIARTLACVVPRYPGIKTLSKQYAEYRGHQQH